MVDDPKRHFAGGPEPRFFTIDKYMGINTQAKREGIKDQQFSWLENMQPIGDNNLQSMFTNGSSIYTAPAGRTIIYFKFFNVAATQYVFIVLDNGTGYSVNVATHVVTTVDAAPGAFYPGPSILGGPLPAASQWAQSGLVIIGPAYYAWDGANFYSPGQPSPSWLNGGTPTTMPTGIVGTCLTTYASRVWYGDGAIFASSAPANGADYTANDGATTTPSSDAFLVREFTSLYQVNGFLYLFADSSINVISNVQSSSSPVITTFNNQNVDPQVGTPWHNSVQPYGNGLIFANSTGVYALKGGTAEKISEDLDGIFEAAQSTLTTDPAISQPTSATMVINNIKCYMLLVPVKGPLDSSFRNALVMWDGRKWFIGSQTSSLTFIGTQEINSIIQAWGTDGTNIFPLFTTSSGSLTKLWQTKLWSGEGFQITKQAMRLYTMGVDNSTQGFSFSGTLDAILENEGQYTESITGTSNTFMVTWVNNSSQAIQWQNSTPANVYWTSTGASLIGTGININSRGNYMGLTVQSTSPNFTLITQSLLYQEQSPLGA